MNYMMLARKTRPQQLKEVIGQSVIVKSFSNAVVLKRIHQAYLLTGSRGVGKTSLARIFAKLNRCPQTRVVQDLLETCDTCEDCISIQRGNHPDVIEIDGASHNGVEAVRNLREQAKFMPHSGSKKIYIIDEVHMLSTAAFNALLKILEEPPAHILFIFATTEVHKLPDTILSRCQRFDLKRISENIIQQHCEKILQKDSIPYESLAVQKIAHAADGSLRDALSILDQILTFSGHHIQMASVEESLGLVQEAILLELLEGVLQKNTAQALSAIQKIYDAGHDLQRALKSLLENLHALMLLKMKITAPASSKLTSLLPHRSVEELEMIFQVYHQGLEWLSHSTQAKIILDVLTIKCATAEALVYVQDVSTSLKPETPTHTWEDFLKSVEKTEPMISSLLEHVVDFQLPSAQNTTLCLFFQKNSFFKDQLTTAQRTLHAEAQKFFGATTEVNILESDQNNVESFAQKQQKKKEAALEKQKQTLAEHPLLTEAKALFQTELGPIQLK